MSRVKDTSGGVGSVPDARATSRATSYRVIRLAVYGAKSGGATRHHAEVTGTCRPSGPRDTVARTGPSETSSHQKSLLA